MNVIEGSGARMKENYDQSKQVLIFSHIPKTAGSTIRQIIQNQYEKKSMIRYLKMGEASEERLARMKVLYGHCRFGVHHQISQPFKYITMLRDPIERVISTYYYAQRKPENRMHERATTMDFMEFIQEEIKQNNPAIVNHQTRFVSGEKNPNLEMAKHHIQEYYAVVGLTEMFNESIFLMKESLGWDNIDYISSNVTKNRPKQENFSKEAISLIREHNQLDLELYDYAKHILLDRLCSLPTKAKEELENYSTRVSIQGKEE